VNNQQNKHAQQIAQSSHGEEESIQEYMYTHIPIVQANKFTIQSRNHQIQVSGSLSDHVNHRNSAFGGSISTALTIAAWAAVRSLIPQHERSTTVIVIQSERVEFTKPVVQDFIAENSIITDDDRKKLFASLDRHGKARITIRASLRHQQDSEILATFSGDFVVVRRQS
jgi:thioesterase domain-containing protein